MVEMKLVTATGDDYRPDDSLSALCPAAQELGNKENRKPGLVADYTQEHEYGDQTDEDYLFLYSTSCDSPYLPGSPFNRITSLRQLVI